jgi:serine/threonine protein kinase
MGAQGRGGPPFSRNRVPQPPPPIPPTPFSRRHFSTDARDLIKKLLTPDRTRRLGCLYGAARDVKEHPWFAGIKWDDVVAGRLTAPLVPKVRDANDTSNFDDYPDSDGDTAGKLTAKDAAPSAAPDTF